MRIAMWSGPRNLSTAMMYSFAQRDDFEVVDEPFYAAYLAQTGLEHPMSNEILASQPNLPLTVIDKLSDLPNVHRYEKHMTHHMLDNWSLDWLADVVNVFLIRHPARVIASYAVKRQNATADDLGFRRQFELFQHVQTLGQKPIVVDSADIRAAPQTTLALLCESIELPFDRKMLSWSKGPNPADGVWAKHWYGAIHNSTGFAGAEGPLPDVEDTALLDETMQFYRAMRDVRLN